jgi:hypothetical protein
VVVIAGLLAFAYYKYSRMSESEKEKIHDDIKEIGEKVVKELIPEGVKGVLSTFK